MKPTKKSIIDASSDYLTDCLPDNYDTWTKEELDKYLENNSWEPFENYPAEDIWEFIEDKAVWIDTNNKPNNKTTALIKELSISVACMLDDSNDWDDYLGVKTFKQKDVEHLQDLITKLENIVEGKH